MRQQRTLLRITDPDLCRFGHQHTAASMPHVDRLGRVLAGIQRLHFTHPPQADQLHTPLVGPRDDVLIDRIKRCIPPVLKRWERQRRIACIQHAGKHLI